MLIHTISTVKNRLFPYGLTQLHISIPYTTKASLSAGETGLGLWDQQVRQVTHLPLAGVGVGQHLEERVQSPLSGGVASLRQLLGSVPDALLVEALVTAHEGYQTVFIGLHPLQL